MDEKYQLLSQLYTLRAGMSWISQKKREIDTLQNSVKVPAKLTENQVLQKHQGRIEDIKSAIQQNKNEKNAIFLNLTDGRGCRNPVGLLVIFLVLLAFGGAIGFAYWGYSFVVRDGWTIDSWWMPCRIAGGLLIIGGLIALVFFCFI